MSESSSTDQAQGESVSESAKLETADLRKEYGDLVAVDDVDLSIRKEEFMAILGPSGSGKTTLLHMISGLETPTSGRIYLDGEEITDVPAEDRDIGLIFQNLALFRKLTVRENLGFVPSINGATESEIDRVVKDIAQTVGIDESMLDREAGQLNPNEQQRVAIGRSVVAEPGLLLLDEPMDNLDEHQAINLRGELKKLQSQLDQTMVYVTHDQTEAMSLADRIVVMHEGRIQQIGSPRELYEQPINEFIAGFIGSPSMNFFEGTLSASGLSVLGTSVPADLLEVNFDQFDELSQDDPVTIGVRPEDIRPGDSEADIAFSAAVTEFEPTGAEELIHGLAGDEEFTLLSDERTGLGPGDSLTAGISIADLYLFHPQTREAIY